VSLSAERLSRRQGFRLGLVQAADAVRGRHIIRALSEMRDSETWPASKWRALQLQRLNALLSHAREHVPYYEEILNKAGVLEPLKDVSEIAALPTLDKQIIREAYPEEIVSRVAEPKDKVVGKTGGSTGEPLTFLYNRLTRDYAIASFLRGLSWAGCALGCRTLRVWGAPITRGPFATEVRRRIGAAMMNERVVNAFRFDDEKLRAAVRLIAQWKPQLVYGYVSGIQRLGEFMESQGFRPSGIKAVATTAEPLTDEGRETIERCFNAPAYNCYAFGEINGIAYECEHRQGSHVSTERALVEVVDHRGRPLPAGEEGLVCVTDLFNFTMPFVRYLPGDVGVLTDERCACGRTLPRLRKILGRTFDFLEGVNGSKANAQLFNLVFHSVGWTATHNLRQYLLFQYEPHTVHLMMAFGTVPRPESVAQAEALMREYLGAGMRFEWEFVDSVPATRNGKWRHAINLIGTGKRIEDFLDV
jgi:phenylacetate-CoA ligase